MKKKKEILRMTKKEASGTGKKNIRHKNQMV